MKKKILTYHLWKWCFVKDKFCTSQIKQILEHDACKYRDFPTSESIFCNKLAQHGKQSDKCSSSPKLNRKFGKGGTGAAALGRATGRKLQLWGRRSRTGHSLGHEAKQRLDFQEKSRCSNCAMFWKGDCSSARALVLIRVAAAAGKGKYDQMEETAWEPCWHLCAALVLRPSCRNPWGLSFCAEDPQRRKVHAKIK